MSRDNRMGSPTQQEPMTKEQLEAQTDIPEGCKVAIEHAIWEHTDHNDPEEDKTWADHFRALEVRIERECEPLNEYKIDAYEVEAMWFRSGWEARGTVLEKQ